MPGGERSSRLVISKEKTVKEHKSSVTALDDESLEAVVGGEGANRLACSLVTLNVKSGSSADVYTSPDKASGMLGFHSGGVSLGNCIQETGADGGTWYYVPAQNGVAAGYVMGSSVTVLQY